MMTEKQRIEWLLELQEHPEQVTDDQLQQLLADPQMRQLVQQLGFTKRALLSEELKVKSGEFSVDEEWERFAASHAEQLAALSESEKVKVKSEKFATALHKIAASFIGLLFVSGIAFAAVHIVRHFGHRLTRANTESVSIRVSPMQKSTQSVAPADSTAVQPVVFDNVTLDTMLAEIGAAHHVAIEFQNEDARQLRFHFVWKREDSLDRVVEKLNIFEAVNIVVENDKLILR